MKNILILFFFNFVAHEKLDEMTLRSGAADANQRHQGNSPANAQQQQQQQLNQLSRAHTVAEQVWGEKKK